MPEDQRSYSSYLFRRDLIQFQLANSRKIVSDLKQAGRGIDRGQGLCPPRYEHGNAADGHRPRSRRRSRAFPSSPRICADAAALLDRVSRLVPPRPPATGVALPPLPAFHLRSAASARPKTPLPPLALVKRPAPIPDAVELAYETCAWPHYARPAFSLSPNRLPKSTARSMRSRRSDVAQFAQIPSS